MRWRSIPLAFLILFVAAVAMAQELRIGRIDGNSHFSDAEIREIIEQSGGMERAAVGLNRLLERYKSDGYFFVWIDSTHGVPSGEGIVSVDLSVREGEPLTVRAVRVEGIQALDSEAVIRRFKVRPGSAFREHELEEDIAYMLEEYENNGHPFASVTLEPFEPNAELGIDVRLRVEEGSSVTVDSLLFFGAEVTRAGLLRRESGIRLGALYDEREMDRALERLRRLEYISDAEGPELLGLGLGRTGVRFRVWEESANSLYGIAGYMPGEVGGQSGFFTGLVDVSFRNMFGTGRRLGTRWEKRDRLTEEFEVFYQEPWAMGYPVHLGIGFMQLAQDSSYVKRTISFSQEYPLRWNLIGRTGVSRTAVNASTPGRIGPYFVASSRTLSVEGGFEYDTRDDRLNPRRGLLYETSVAFGRKEGEAGDTLSVGRGRAASVRKVQISTEYNLEAARDQVLSIGLNAAEITSNEAEVAVSDQYRFGGAKSLRGYREDAFRGSRIAWSNLEYRFLLSRRSRAFVFFDYGYFWREDRGKVIRGGRAGYGLGVRLDTLLGVIGLDYGFGKEDTFSTAKVHLTLANRF